MLPRPIVNKLDDYRHRPFEFLERVHIKRPKTNRLAAQKILVRQKRATFARRNQIIWRAILLSDVERSAAAELGYSCFVNRRSEERNCYTIKCVFCIYLVCTG